MNGTTEGNDRKGASMRKTRDLGFNVSWLLVACLLGTGPAIARAADKPSPVPAIQFRTERAGVSSINLYRPDGTLARRLLQAQRLTAGLHKIDWDGRAEDGTALAPGDYTWRGLFHEGVGLKLRGWAANGGTTPWPTPDGKGDWGGDTGVPSAVATDTQRVYLGWSLAEQGKSILACDLAGRIQWAHRRAEGASGCKALSVDDGVLFVLGGLAGTGAEGGCVYRLNAKDGKPMPWPNGQLDLKIASFWPPEANAKPEKADAMAVRHDRIYLSFTQSQFLTVLDAKTGAYLQTVVGMPPGQIDVAATKTNLPDAPDKLVDADFAVIALGNGILGKVLFAHDPLWVITSALVGVNQEMHVNALTVIGDSGKFHRHEAIIGLGRPYHQIQARPLLDTEEVTWIAGKSGGRPLLGPWEPIALREIRALAMAADGKLWVAEGDGFPKRFSVWNTSGEQGQMEREFFGPTESNRSGGAINPLDPDLMFAQGCEWRIDRETGGAKCLGVVTREPIENARYGVGENGLAYLVVEQTRGWLDIFERAGDGDYRLRAQIHHAAADGTPTSPETAVQTILWADENDDGAVQPGENHALPAVLRFHAEATLQDLALTATSGTGGTRLFPVKDWTSCGAPRYDLAAGIAVGVGQVSADGKLRLLTTRSAGGPTVSCQSLGEKQPRWSVPLDAVVEPVFMAGIAKLPDPLRNVWLLSREHAPWVLVNEDGFEIARFFAPDSKGLAWPKSAKPGAEMARVQSGRYGALAQAIDGKLYLQTGNSAAWNLEVTGLEKVQALTGGSVTVPPSP